MVFALQRQVTKKGKNSISTKQVPIIRYKNEAQQQREADIDMGTICNVCKWDMLKVDGCKPRVLLDIYAEKPIDTGFIKSNIV